MSRRSGGVPSVTAWARVARTAAESASYCCAPACACKASVAAQAARPARHQAAKLARHVRARMLQALREERSRFLHRHLGGRGLATVLVFDHPFLEPAIA